MPFALLQVPSHHQMRVLDEDFEFVELEEEDNLRFGAHDFLLSILRLPEVDFPEATS